jgi:hypothetical protein
MPAATPSKGFIGRGTIVSIGVNGTPETFTAVAQMRTAQFNGQKINFEDISNLDSPLVNNTLLKEIMPATADAGTLDITGIFLPSDQGQLAVAAAYGGGLTDFTVQLPKGPGQVTKGNSYAFSGYVAEMPIPDVQFDKVVTIKFKIQLQTVITPTPGS